MWMKPGSAVVEVCPQPAHGGVFAERQVMGQEGFAIVSERFRSTIFSLTLRLTHGWPRSWVTSTVRYITTMYFPRRSGYSLMEAH